MHYSVCMKTKPMKPSTEALRLYLNDLPRAEQIDLAERCETTIGHLRNIVYDNATCSEKLAIALERESKAALKVEDLCPGADWKYIRGTAKRRKPILSKTA